MSDDAVHYRDLTNAVGQLRTDVVAELRVVADRMERRHDALDGRVTDVEVRLAAHERQSMHDGTRQEFSRMEAAVEQLTDALRRLAVMVAYGAGAGAVLFLVAQVVLAAVL